MHSHRILIVDDTNEVRTLFCRVLAAEGYDIVEAADGISALQACQNLDGDVHPVDDFPELDLKIQSPSESEPGNPIPIDPLPIEMRPVDRERLPISIVPVVAMGVAPLAARRVVIRYRCCCRLRALRHDRGARHARGRGGGGGRGLGRRRSGRRRRRFFGAAGKG